MSGLDVAAGAAGIISLSFSVFQGCVNGFVLISTAQNFGRDADFVRTKLEFEQYRLFEWASKVGLSSPHSNGNINWTMAKSQLDQLDALLNDTEKLKQKYELNLETTDEIITPGELAESRKGLRKALAFLKPRFVNETALRLHESSTPWKRLKWAAYDKDGMNILLQHITSVNNNLYELLDSVDRIDFRNALGLLLRTLVSQAPSTTDLEIIKRLSNFGLPTSDNSIFAAASLKQENINLSFDNLRSRISPGFDSRASTLQPSLIPSQSSLARSKKSFPPAARLSLKSFKGIASSELELKRELAFYDGKTVLLEWKSVSKIHDQRLKHRIADLATLLGGIRDPSFHSLVCLGYIKGTANRYAYVFVPPERSLAKSIGSVSIASSSSHCTNFKTLHQLLLLEEKRPSLNSRLKLASTIAETVLQLHTAGWLHKGIRSDNILFFQEPNHDWADGGDDLDPVFLAGYEYARADSPLDMTELPSLQRETEIYRHPALASGAASCLMFDLYALGCVLVEIGLWCCLQNVLLRSLRAGKKAGNSRLVVQSSSCVLLEFEGGAEENEIARCKSSLLATNGKGSILRELEFAIGQQYMEAVEMCFHARDAEKKEERNNKTATMEDSEDEDERGASIAMHQLEETIIEKLKMSKI